MRMSNLLVSTQREAPSDADAVGHALLVRAGYVRRLTSGVYSLLPLGMRVYSKIMAIVREEQNAAGMQEILMPVLSPIELWDESGRSALFGQDALPAMTLDVRGGTFVLGPTHEEVVTTLVAAEVSSYRQLPVTVYQVQLKFRDEARPRSGLLRLREFTMSDGYSFDATPAGMQVSYDAAVEAYKRIFSRIDVHVVPVAAVSGAMGGSVSHEFMVPTTIGEDFFASCPSCGLAANVEAAVRQLQGEPVHYEKIVAEPLRAISTPGASTIDALAALLKEDGVTPLQLVKSIAVFDENDLPVVILLPGDREARVPAQWRLFEEDDFKTHPNITKGFLGPVGLEGARVVADESLRYIDNWLVTGANKIDDHHVNVVLGRDFTPESFDSYVVVETGDLCPNCAEPMTLQRSVEAAHTFQLGLRYSEVMNNATFLDEEGNVQPYWMGCYGLGVSRLFAVLAEGHHDDDGLIWPASVAPFDVVLVSLSNARSPGVAEASDRAYEALKKAGVDVLYDDRDVSPGVKFADADLLGIPLRVTVGAKGLERGIVEVRNRANGEITELPLAALLAGQLRE